MRVLIVSRTKMSGVARCIGGISDSGDSLRLLMPNGPNWNTSAPLQIGDVWEINYTPVGNTVAPHVEDVICSTGSKVDTVSNLGQHLLTIVQPWMGCVTKLFGGVLGFTGNGNGYVSQVRGVPTQSTGFWLPDRDLSLSSDGKHYHYPYGIFSMGKGGSYVGEPAAIGVIPAGSLVRVSLARWWKPQDIDDLEERCYLQISGWY